ncbi:hypothetical protein [Acinetobacter baumannii]|nr:hypothetical protein [Acinetobacter baumannii]UWY67553.1 hypothetical protein N4T40_14020 [Acinetobacter baumannii]
MSKLDQMSEQEKKGAFRRIPRSPIRKEFWSGSGSIVFEMLYSYFASYAL